MSVRNASYRWNRTDQEITAIAERKYQVGNETELFRLGLVALATGQIPEPEPAGGDLDDVWTVPSKPIRCKWSRSDVELLRICREKYGDKTEVDLLRRGVGVLAKGAL